MGRWWRLGDLQCFPPLPPPPHRQHASEHNDASAPDQLPRPSLLHVCKTRDVTASTTPPCDVTDLTTPRASQGKVNLMIR